MIINDRRKTPDMIYCEYIVNILSINEFRLEKQAGIVINDSKEDDIILSENICESMLLNNFSKSILVSLAIKHVYLEDAIICNTVANLSINVPKSVTCLIGGL